MTDAVIGCARATLDLPGCHSLKEKRAVLQPLLRRLRQRHPVAAAEVAEQDRWQRAVIALVCVSGQRPHADALLATTLDTLRSNEGDYRVGEITTELISL